MIKFYNNGIDFLKENENYLMENEYLSSFFFLDAIILKETNKKNYAFKIEDGDNKLLVLKVEPFNILVYGSEELSKEAVDILINEQLELLNILGEEKLCDAIVENFKSFGINYYEALAMDFMQTNSISIESDDRVMFPTLQDVDEIYEMLNRFVIDCGLVDKVKKESVIDNIADFRIIKEAGKIVSMARICVCNSKALKISDVYTRDEYRGKGYAKMVVNVCKNDIINSGYIATLNVDKKNPISNKLYYDLGFRKLFSQGEYRQIKQ